MTKDDLTQCALGLPIEEQLELAQTLWDHASPADDLVLPVELRRSLESRLAEARRNPEAGVPWEEVRARLRGRA